MMVRIEMVCVSADGSEERRQMLGIERQELAMETLGMNLAESKALLEGVQDYMVAQQVSENLEQRRACLHCGRRHTAKGSGSTRVKTLFGRVNVPNPRWNRCACQTQGPETFRPTTAWLQGRTSVEMLYLESKWASLIPFAKVADLLMDVLPVADSVNQESVCNHMQATAERIEQELGNERQLNEYEGTEDDESGRNRVLGRVVDLRIDSWAECWVPSPKCILPLFVEHARSNLEQKMCSALTPPHLLAFYHPLADNLIDC